MLGFEPALSIIAGGFLLSAVVMIGAPDPRTDVPRPATSCATRGTGSSTPGTTAPCGPGDLAVASMNLAGGAIEIVVPFR